jgi:hypothetical protein
MYVYSYQKPAFMTRFSIELGGRVSALGGCGGNQLRWGFGRRGCKYWYAYQIPNEVDSLHTLQVQKPFHLTLH